MGDAPARPVLRWHGGKWRLAPWIVEHPPPHRVYTEAFGGAASVLLRKPRSYAEVYNDLDDDAVTLFRVLRDPAQAEELQRRLVLTPFARVEFREAYEPSEDPVERARRLVVRSFMGFGSNAHACAAKGHRSTGFRADARRSGTTPARDWASYPAELGAVVRRLTGVTIEHRDAREVLQKHDSPETLHYVDPPYLPETRSRGAYRHEMTREDHAALLEVLAGLRGMAVLSGYPSPLYDGALAGWHRVERETYADGALPRREVLWLNPAADQALAGRLRLEVADA